MNLRNIKKGCIALAGICALLLCVSIGNAQSAPQRLIYNGHLLDSSGNPITTNHNVRFSFWTSTNFVVGDTTATGAINTGAANFANWVEVNTVTPNANGYFTVELGSGTTLPDFGALPVTTLRNLHLQVEVKAAASPDTSYELMDINTSDDTVDRSAIRSVPFALNADMVDQRHVGTGSGDLAALSEGGIFLPSQIPGGTASGAFVIDFDDTETSEVALKFGTTLAKILSYDILSSYFKFNDDVYIEGDLTVTGLINGIDITTLTDAAATHLRVSSGAGLNVDIAAGSYRINGVAANYLGGSSLPILDNTTNYVFFSSTGLVINQTGFPTNRSIIRLAEVDTSGGTIDDVDDRRIFQSDDRETVTERVLHPQFENASMQGDGSDNTGRLFVDHDGASQRNFYHWTSTNGTLQDYNINVRERIPPGFTNWEDPSIILAYRTTDASALENKVEVEVYDTAGAAVTLSGSTTDLTSVGWATTRIEFTGSPTFTAGSDMLIRIKVFARNDEQAHVGNLELEYGEFAPIP